MATNTCDGKYFCLRHGRVNVLDPRGAGAPDIQVRRSRGPNNEDIMEIIVPAFEQATDRGFLDGTLSSNLGASRRPLPGS